MVKGSAHYVPKRGSPHLLRKKRQVLRTRRPTGLDRATLTARRASVKARPVRDHRPPGAAGSPSFLGAELELLGEFLRKLYVLDLARH